MKTQNGRWIKAVGMSAFMTAVVAVGAIGVSATQSKAIVRHCICPQIVAPVKCSNGVEYINSCYASCAGATGCVRTGDI